MSVYYLKIIQRIGLRQAERLHCHTGSDAQHVCRLLADDLGEQLQHCGHDHQHKRERTSKRTYNKM